MSVDYENDGSGFRLFGARWNVQPRGTYIAVTLANEENFTLNRVTFSSCSMACERRSDGGWYAAEDHYQPYLHRADEWSGTKHKETTSEQRAKVREAIV